jgi:hypothetical protein
MQLLWHITMHHITVISCDVTVIIHVSWQPNLNLFFNNSKTKYPRRVHSFVYIQQDNVINYYITFFIITFN